ncbi:MAG: hypothetical protein RBR93_12235 [Aliarcobacter butzleri]|nr:hypothetical protein [Aliarcobacter butzleri]
MLKALEILKKYQDEIQTSIPSEIDLNEVIAELEALNNRSCENCKHLEEREKNLKFAELVHEIITIIGRLKMKGIELTRSQIKAYENGAIKFLFPIDNQELCRCAKYEDEFIKNYAPIQKGDKDIFIQEDFAIFEKSVYYDDEYMDEELKFTRGCESFKASKMTKEQSRYSFSECIDVKVIKVQDIEWVMGFHFQRFYNRCMEERNINRTYKDNDYVFSVEFKK